MQAAALPTLFLSHGSPMHALQPGAVRAVWEGIARALPRPEAILIASAHWETNLPALSGAAQPETIHDFYGFPKPLYEIQYPAPGAPDIAAWALKLLQENKFKASLDPARGLDHGAWSPLLYMYPDADVPVVQLSLQTRLGARHHLALGRALRPLAGEGVLMIGSGLMTHNLRERRRDDGATEPYVLEFRDWIDARIREWNLDSLAEYRTRAPHAARAHPTDEHFQPIFFALGAAGDGARAQHLYDTVESGVLAMDTYRFDPA
jgi:4,5-DOPA dioxygenase extradiol